MKSTASNLSISKILPKKKICKFKTKKTLFGFFWTKIWKMYSHIWNQPPQNCLIAKVCKMKQKCLNLGPKMPYLRYSGLDSQKNYFDIWNQYPWICQIRKFVEEKTRFWYKKYYIWVFWSWKFQKLLSYLKSTASNLWISKILLKEIKNLSICNQECLI